VVARLRRNATIAQAQAATDIVAARLERQFPATNKGIAVKVLRERLARPEEDNARTNAAGTTIMTILVGLVLVVASVNVTNLLLARAVGRQREIAIRAALGAGRGRIFRQLLIESLLLAAGGGIAGVLLGAWSGNLIARIQLPGDLPVWFDFHPDWRVLAYTAMMALAAGIAVGIPPALRATRRDLDEMLRGSRSGFVLSCGRHRAPSALVAAQIAICFVLLAGGGLFIRSLARAERLDLGFQPRGVLNVHMDVGQLAYTEAQGRVFFRDIEERVRAVPGVVNLSSAFTIPMGYVYSSRTIDAEGRPEPAHDRPAAGMNMVSPGYFDTMGIPIIRGRSFTKQDDEQSPRVAIINERLARELWPDRNPLGQRFSFTGREGPWVKVVGVTRTGKYHLLFEDPQPYFYVPLEQFYSGVRVLQVRTTVPPETLIQSIERIIHAREPELALFDAQSMARALGGGYGLFLVRVGAAFAAIFATLGLALAAVGLYGVVSYATGERTHEVGVRMALGASPRHVLSLALRQALTPVAAGISLGLVGVISTARLTSSLLFGTTPNDPLTLVEVSLFLVIVALGASYVPARRASQIDPMTALRHE